MRFIYMLLVLIALSQPAFATTYYIAANGNDGNNGTSSSTPWKSYQKVQGANAVAGDIFLFRCGDTWRINGSESFVLSRSGSGTVSNPNFITYGAYGSCSPKTQYPIFTRSVRVTSGFVSAGTANGGDVYSMNIAGTGAAKTGPNWFFNGLRAAWNGTHYNSSCPGNMTQDYEVCYKGGTDPSTVYVRVPSGAGNPQNLSNPGAEYLDSTKSKATIEITGSWIALNKLRMWKNANCIAINKPSQLNISLDDIRCEEMAWTVEENTTFIGGKYGSWTISINGPEFENVTGFFNLLNSYLYGSGRDFFDTDRSMPDGNITLAYNTFDTGYNHGIAYLGKDSKLGSPNPQAHGTWYIHDNVAKNICGGWGFGAGSVDTGGFDSLVFERNINTNFYKGSTIQNGGIPRFRTSHVDCGEFPDAFLTSGNDGPTNVTIRKNIIVGAVRGMTLKGGSDHRADVYNNTIINSSDSGIFLDNYGTLRLYNNVFSDTGESIKCQGGGCGAGDLQNNYFAPRNSSSYVSNWAGTKRTLSASKSELNQFKSSNIGNSNGSEPSNLFVNRTALDFTPGTNSPLIDAGRKNPPSFTYVGSTLDIGAIEKGEGGPISSPAPTLASARIENATPNRLDLTFSTGTPPMLPTSGCTGITLSGTSAAPSSCVRVSNLVMQITLNASVTGGDTVTLSYSQSTGNIVDTSGVELDNLSGYAVVNAVSDPPLLSIARIESATPTRLDLTFATDAPPMLPASGCTGITLSGTSAAPSSCTRFSSYVMHITLNQEPADDDVITLSYSQSTGNITSTPGIELANLSGFPVINALKQNLLTLDNMIELIGTPALGREIGYSYDGDTATEQGSTGSNLVSQFRVTHDLGDLYNLGSVRIFGDANGSWYCSTWKLEYATDCCTWQTWADNLNCFGNQWWTQDLNGVSAQCLRFTINGNQTDGRTQWYELEAYGAGSSGGGEPPPPPPPPPPFVTLGGISITGAIVK